MNKFLIIFIASAAFLTFGLADAVKAEASPDLAIDSVAFDPTYGYPIVTIKNVGTGRAQSLSAVEVKYTWTTPPEPGWVNPEVYTLSYDIDLDLAPGETYIAEPASPSADFAPMGGTQIYIRINYAQNLQVNESNYENNLIITDISFPDLAIDSVAFDPTYGYPIIVIKNVGTNKAKHPAFNISYEWTALDPIDTWRMNLYTRSYEVNLDLNPGQTYLAKPANPTSAFTPQDATEISLKIGGIGGGRPQVVEFGYSNNSAVVPASWPDLAIDSVAFDPTYGYPIVTIKNVGTGRAKSLPTMEMVTYIWTTPSQSGSMNTDSHSRSYENIDFDLAPGETYIAEPASPSADFAPVGGTNIDVNINYDSDRDLQIAESNYTNNSTVVDVSFPDLAIDSIAFDSTHGYPIVAIKNIGNNKAKHSAFIISYDWSIHDPINTWKVDNYTRSYNINLDLAPGETYVAQPANAASDFAPLGATSIDLKIGETGGGPQIVESQYMNNHAIAATPVFPDLIIDSVTFDSAARTPIVIVSNAGAGPANFEQTAGPTIKVSCHKFNESDGNVYTCEEKELSAVQSNLAAGAQMTVEFLPVEEDVEYIDVSVNIPAKIQEVNAGNNSKNNVFAPIYLAKPALLGPICEADADDPLNNNFFVDWSWPGEERASDYQIEIFDSTRSNLLYQEWTNNAHSFTMANVPPNTMFFAHYRSTTDRVNVSPWSDTALVVCAKSTVTTTETEEIIKELIYPIEELGNCASPEECRVYCDNAENASACAEFGISSGLMTEEEGEAAEEIDEISEDNPGPGSCTTKESCAEFCEVPANIEACLNYAEQNNWMSADDLSKARKVVGVLQSGGVTPGGCNTPGGCKNYCSDNTHAVECVSFGKSAGLLTAEEAAEAEKIAPLMQSGQTPGGKTSKEELELYCENNHDECDQFFEQAGVKKGNDATTIFEGRESGGPGGCQTKAECDAYCDAHPGECDQAVIEAGGEVKEVTAVCSTREECEAFCNDPTNKEAEACTSGTIIIKEESPESAGPTEGPGEDPLEKLRSDIQEIISQSQSQDCVKQILGEEVFTKFVIERGIPEKAISREELQPCFDEAKRVIEQEEMLKMQKKPDDPDMGNPPPSGKISTFLASVINILNWFRK